MVVAEVVVLLLLERTEHQLLAAMVVLAQPRQFPALQ
jgi:hypothetical protein